MKDIVININNKTRAVTINSNVLGCVGEHLQGNIYIDFKGKFIKGTCFLLFVLPNGESGYIPTQKHADKKMYSAPIKSSLLANGGQISLQVKITEYDINEETPIFKSVVFNMIVEDSITTQDFTPEDIEDIDALVMAKLTEFDETMERAETKINKKISECDEVLSQIKNEAGAFVFDIKPNTPSNVDKGYKVWAVSGLRYKVKIEKSEFGLAKPYIDDCIVNLESGVREKAILDMLELVNGNILIYSNLQIDCKIILKGE